MHAEAKAKAYLLSLGYDILKTRFKTPYGEVDIIAAHAQTIIAVEVKFRKNISQAAYAIKRSNQNRIQQAVTFFLQQFPAYVKKIPFHSF